MSTSVPLQGGAPHSFLQRIGLVPSGNDLNNNKGTSTEGTPGDALIEGLGNVAKKEGNYYVKQGPGEVAGGLNDVVHGDIAKGGHRVFSGTMVTAAPLAPEAIASNPLLALKAAGFGYFGGKLAGTGARMMDATPDQQQLAEDFGNVLGGLAGQKLSGQAFANAVKRSGGMVTKIGDRLQGIDPDILEMVSPRLAAMQRIAAKDPLNVLPKRAQAVANVITKMSGAGGPVAPAAAGDTPIPQELAPQINVPPSRQFIKPGNPVVTSQPPQTAATVSELGKMENVKIAPKGDYNLPNATYLRDDIRSQTQQPPIQKSKTPLLDGLRQWSMTQRVNDEMNQQDGSPMEEQVMRWISDHNQNSAGGKQIKTRADFERALMQEAASEAKVPIPPDIPRTPQNSQDMMNLLEQSIAKVKAGKLSVSGGSGKINIPPETMAQYPHLGGDIPTAPKIPQQGQFPAVRTDDGQVFVDTSPGGSTHVTFMKRMGIPPDRVEDGGWMIDGVYEPSDRSDSSRYADRARATLRVLQKRGQ